MKIFLNNKEEVFEHESMSIADMLEAKKLTYKLRIIKINGILIAKEKYDDVRIQDGDNIQVIYLMSGG